MKKLIITIILAGMLVISGCGSKTKPTSLPESLDVVEIQDSMPCSESDNFEESQIDGNESECETDEGLEENDESCDDIDTDEESIDELFEPGTIGHDFVNLNVSIDDVTIKFNKTTPSDLFDKGYNIKPLFDEGFTNELIEGVILHKDDYKIPIILTQGNNYRKDNPVPPEERLITGTFESITSTDFPGPYKLSVNGFKVGENPDITWEDAIKDMFPSINIDEPTSIEEDEVEWKDDTGRVFVNTSDNRLYANIYFHKWNLSIERESTDFGSHDQGTVLAVRLNI